MSPFFSGFLKIAFGLALVLFILWGLNQFGIIDTKTVILQTAGLLPDLHDLPQNYELGKKRSDLLTTKEKELQDFEAKLKDGQAKLAKDRNSFEEMKNKWLNEHPTTSNKYIAQSNTVVPPLVGKFPEPSSEQKIKNYLNMVGSMKPQQAAAVIQKLPEETVFAIFDQLRPNQVTKIMEKLPESYLSKLTQDRLNKYRNI